MKKQIITAISTHPIRAAFLLILPFLLGPPMHQALGQGNAGNRSVAANMPQVAPPSTGAITGTYAPAKPAPNISAIGQSLSAISQSQLPTASSGPTGANPGTCSWVVRTPVPYNARGPFAVSDGTVVYVGGGYDGSTVHTDLLRYDPVANNYTPLASSPDQHFLSQAVIFNNKIYNIAGFGAAGVTNTTRIYDIPTNTWTTGAPCPASLSDHATALWNGIIYVAAGYNGSGAVNTLYAYNIAGDSWTTLAPLPQALFLPGFGAINGKLYIASGNNGSVEVNTLYIYDIASNTWTTGATVPTAVTGPGSTVFNGKLYLYGGGFPTTLTITQIYDPALNSWSSGPNMNVNRLWFYGTAVGGGSIVAPGGDTTPGIPINDNEQLTGCGGGGCIPGWSAGADLPSVGVRSAGVFFPANGKFYAMGGRSSDAGGSEFTHPFEYDPVANTWTTKAATYPDTHTNNMACGVLTDAGTPYIYCAGGSQVTVVGTFDRVFRYNPVTDVISPVAAPWPGGLGMVLPGGFTVLNNKLYILGGFDTITGGGQGTSQIWEFTPPTTWVQKASVLPVPLGYIPTTTIGTLIYTGGGSDITAGVLTDTTNSFVYNPVANTIGTIAAIPRATGETRALFWNGKMLVMGGGRTAPNPSNEVDAYDPVGNMWTVNSPVPAFTTARRNFPTDTDGTQHIWLSGGYAPSTPTASTEVFCQGATIMAQSAFSRKVHGGGACQFRVLIVYADSTGLPSQLQSEILAEPNVTAVDLFDATAGTPTLAQLQQYQIVVPFSNSPFLDGDTLGNNLADYVDGGGFVVQYGFSHYGPSQPYGVNGRWVTGNYNPYNYSTNLVATAFTLGAFNAGHPLMAGVTTLNSNFQNVVTLAAGATEVAAASNGNSLVAFRPVGGHTTVGVTAYVGASAAQSGHWGRVIVNAGRWLSGTCGTAFDIPLPLTGNVGIECRTGPTYQMIINFASSVTVGSATVTSGTGNVTNFSGNGTPQITVNLDSVIDIQRITVTLHNVTDGISDVPVSEVPVSMGVLIGDVNGSTGVNSTDVALTKSKVGQTLDNSNFREDVNFNGVINAGDVTIVKSKVGHALPP